MHTTHSDPLTNTHLIAGDQRLHAALHIRLESQEFGIGRLLRIGGSDRRGRRVRRVGNAAGASGFSFCVAAKQSDVKYAIRQVRYTI